MTNPLAQDLGGVVRLLEKATPGEWPEPEASRFVPDKFNVGDSAPYTLVGRDEDDLRAAVASVNFLRTHSAEIAVALRDADRYRWLREHFRFANDSMHEIWFDDTLEPNDSGVPTYLDQTIDSAMQQGGGGGDHA